MAPELVSPTLVLAQLSLIDFRLFTSARVEPSPQGTTVLVGPNGSGKTTVLEAVAFLGSGRSFRGTPREALIRVGADRAYVRGELMDRGHRVTVESEITRGPGEARVQLNRQRARRAELAAAVPVTVFSPGDVGVIHGGPAGRRALLDDALSVLDHRVATAIEETERALRQRAALLRQAGGRLTPEVETTLEVWDERLAYSATVVVAGRRALLEQLDPLVTDAYRSFLDRRTPALVELRYVASWEGSLADALVAHRREDVRRAATTVGPHRDELLVLLDGREARVQASQGEQRSLALALRLAVHRLLTARLGRPPLLLLDDVFSELDPQRSQALLRELPGGQALVSTATPLPVGWEVAKVIDVQGLGS